MAEERTVRRIPPCSGCDPEGLASWLTDMAKEGLYLQTDGIGSRSWHFSKGVPRSVPYRLLPGREKPTLGAALNRRLAEPDQGTRDGYAAQGWEYVASQQHFHIYRGAEDYDGGLRMEPRVEPEAVAWAAQWEWRDVLFWVPMMVVGMPVVFYGVERPEIPLLFFDQYFFALAIFWVAALAFAGYRAVRCLRLKRLRRRLEEGSRPDWQKDWKRGAFFHRTAGVLALVLVIAWSIGSLFLPSPGGADDYSLADYPGEPPFLTLAEMDPGGAVEHHDGGVSQDASLLLPVQILWEETGFVDLQDGKGTRMTSLYLEYYEARTPALAKEMVRELQGAEARYRPEGLSGEPVACPDLGVDFACCYPGKEVLLLRQDAVVIRMWMERNGSRVPVEALAAPMAEALL